MPTNILFAPRLTLAVVFAALLSVGCGQEFKAKDNPHLMNMSPADIAYQQNHQDPNGQRDPRPALDLPQTKSSKPASASVTQSTAEEAIEPSFDQPAPGQDENPDKNLDKTPEKTADETADTNSTTRAVIARPTPKPNPFRDSQEHVSDRTEESTTTPPVRPQSRPQLRPQVREQNSSDTEITEKRDDRDSGSDKAPAKVVRPRARPDDLIKNPTVSQGVQQPARSSLPVHVKGLWEEAHSSGRRWTQITAEAMETYGKQLLATTPSDIKSFCPNFSNLDRDGRMSFWVNLLSAIAIRESRLRPGTSYTEQFKDSSGTKVVSRGLLQISHESAKNYKCPVKSAKDLHDEEINLICGVKILNKWIPADKRIQGSAGRTHLGAGRYWSVMRKGDSLKWIQSQMLQLDFCSDRK